MKTRNMLAQNLKAHQDLRDLTLTAFAEEIGIPKATLRTLLQDGNTTLDTAIRISVGLGIGLDKLVFDENFADEMLILRYFQRAIEWLENIPKEKRKRIAAHVAAIWTEISQAD